MDWVNRKDGTDCSGVRTNIKETTFQFCKSVAKKNDGHNQSYVNK